MSAPDLPCQACTGACTDSHRGCQCDCGAPVGMWDDERRHPWRAAALYAAVIVLVLLASHFYPCGVATCTP